MWIEKSFSAASGCHAPNVQRTLICELKKKFQLSIHLQLVSSHLIAVIMTSAVQPRRRNVFNDVEISANRQQHCDSDEAWRWRISGNRSAWVILQNRPQLPQRARIDEMEIRIRLSFHELLIIGEEIKVRLLMPQLQRLVELARIPSGQRDILEQRIRQKVELRLADHLWRRNVHKRN